MHHCVGTMASITVECAVQNSSSRNRAAMEGWHGTRVLSIQSHVVSGHVGNKAAVFPLQLLGFDVDFINSVQFSNHTGYPNKWKGTVLSGQELSSLCCGLTDNGLLQYDYLLTGYIGSETFLSSVLETLSSIQLANPNARYVCDPVLGDDGRYYVPEAMVQIFRTELLPRAYMITPNQFEAELLSEMKIRSEDDAVAALVRLHKLGPQVVVLSSAELECPPPCCGRGGGGAANGSLFCYVLYPRERQEGQEGVSGPCRITRIEIAKLEGHYTGTGDATTALMLAWVHILQQSGRPDPCEGSTDEEGMDSPYSRALQRALATVKAMIQRSQQRAGEMQGEAEADPRVATRVRELQVVASKRDIEKPPIQDLQVRSVRVWDAPVN